MTSTVELRDVSVMFDRKTAIEQINLDISAGGWLTLIGPNGAGKTTVLRAIAGLVPHRGQISFNGEPSSGLSPRQLARRLAMVRQEPVMPSGMTVAQYVLLGRSAHFTYLGKESRADHRVVSEALERLALIDMSARPLETLSGGERQRAAIARALVQDTPILLVDEPTSALDLGRQQEVLDLIDSERRTRKLTVIAAMHDLTLAGQYADCLALVVGGRLVHHGPPSEVITEAAIQETYQARVRVRSVGEVSRAVVPDRSLPTVGAQAVPREGPVRGTIKASSVVIVNTGDGKGKSTAAFGTLMRAVARGWKVCVIQFIKSGGWRVGEEKSARQLGVDWWAAGDGFTWDSKDMDRTEAVARHAWDAARDTISSERYQLVILDELTYPINWGWIPLADVVASITTRPPTVNVIVTGRDAPAEIVECADTVTEMVNRKHAFDRGVRAIRGIDF